MGRGAWLTTKGRGLYLRVFQDGAGAVFLHTLRGPPVLSAPQVSGVRCGLTTIAVSCPEMAKSPSSSPAPSAPASYEDALTELESLVASMEGGQLPLDRLLASYQRGAELLTLCRSRLEAVEQQVKVLEDGQLKPWTDA